METNLIQKQQEKIKLQLPNVHLKDIQLSIAPYHPIEKPILHKENAVVSYFAAKTSKLGQFYQSEIEGYPKMTHQPTGTVNSRKLYNHEQ